MAKARMLHNKISISSQVNKLSLPAKLLFTWMVAHADDDGKMKGEPAYVKAKVIPMTNWSFKRIEIYLREIRNVGLIYHWEQNNEWFIEFIKWKEHQSIKGDRYKPSNLPSFDKDSGSIAVPKNIQEDSTREPQVKLIESSSSESNEVEIRKGESKVQRIADKKSHSYKIANPKDFIPSNNGENIALNTWKRLEPNNPASFQTTYLSAYKKGVPENLFGQYASEIEQDKTIVNRGAVFNIKVAEYLIGRGVRK